MNQNRQKSDILKLTRGESTRSKMGSRAVPHRLRKDESKRFELAIKKGFLELYESDRPNLLNVYKKWCEAEKKEPVFIVHDLNESTLFYGQKKQRFSSRKEAKIAAKLMV